MHAASFTPTADQFTYTFGGAEPVLRVRPGTALTLWTEDAFVGSLRSITDLASERLGHDLNPQTGPFYVDGAEPGDTLVLHIADLTPARSWGASATIPFYGGLSSTPEAPGLQLPLDERTWIYEYDSATRTVAFHAQGSDFSAELPANPCLGTVGVAPAQREVRTSLVPDYFGGDMDTPEMRTGTTAYFRVNVEGALFSVGDGHFRQGEGEACGAAVEGAMHITVIVDLIKGRGPSWPRLEDDDHIMTVGSARPLENAWKAGQVDMIHWLGELHGLDQLDAYQLLTQIAETPLANVVVTNFSVVTKVDKNLLPGASAYGGMHSLMKDRAAALGSISY